MLTELDDQSTIEAPVPNGPQKLAEGRNKGLKMVYRSSDILGMQHWRDEST